MITLQLAKDVVFIGASKRAEIWDAGRWNAFNDTLTEDSVAAVMDELSL